MGAHRARGAEAAARRGVLEQRDERARQRGRIARRHQHARDAVDDRVEEPPDGARDERHAACHRLDGHDAEGLVPRRADDGVGRAQQGRHRVVRDAAPQHHAIGDAELGRDAAQAAGFAVALELGGRRPAGDHELRARQRGQRANRVLDALPRHEPRHHHEPAQPARARLDRAVGPEVREVDAARHDADVAHVRADLAQLLHLVAAGGDDAVEPHRQIALDVEPLGGARVGGALVAPLHGAERVEGLHDGNRERARRLERRPAGHPEMRVHQIGRAALPRGAEAGGELRHQRPELVLRHARGRAGVDVLDHGAVRERDAVRQRSVVPPRVDDHVEAAPRERGGERRHVDVLAAGVGAAEHRERARMLRHHRDPHATASARSRSQSRRKRARP
jgi:hypothetical protein